MYDFLHMKLNLLMVYIKVTKWLLSLRLTNIIESVIVINGSILNAENRPTSNSFAEKQNNDIEWFKDQRLNYLEIPNQNLINSITFYLEDDDGNAVEFTGQTIAFNISMIKF